MLVNHLATFTVKVSYYLLLAPVIFEKLRKIIAKFKYHRYIYQNFQYYLFPTPFLFKQIIDS